MSFLERQTTRITGTDHHHDGRRKSLHGRQSTGNIPRAKKPRSRPPTSLRDHLPFPNSSLPPASGPYSVGSMEIEVPVEDPRPISHITRAGRHLLRLETVLFTLYYPAAIGSGIGKAPGGHKEWSRETWLPRPRRETAKGYAKFAGIPSWAGLGLFGATSMLTKLRAYRNSPPATHWPPEGNSKTHGYKVKNEKGEPPQGMDNQPIFPLLMFSHGLGGSRTAYSSLCTEFASYGFVVCALEHRDGSGPRTFVNHRSATRNKDRQHVSSEESMANTVCDKDTNIILPDHTEEELRQGHHHVDYIFPKNNPKDTAPNNEQGVDSELRNAQIELRLCELEEAYRVLKTICSGDGHEVERQNLRCEGHIGGSSRGLKGVDWVAWKNRFHVDKMTMAGHSFGAATVVEALRHTDRFRNVQAGIIYDIWGAPIKPPAEDPQHRINLPLLGINSEAFMYWQSNFDAVMSLMKEASEHGSPAYLLTVRGSVHVSQSDFSVIYKHIVSFFLKATVHPNRAIDLNISASLEFLKLVAPHTGSGRAIIDRCLANESFLETDLLEEVPDENRPQDEWIAARLHIDHEFRRRIAASLQRKAKRNLQDGKGKHYTPADEMWCHFKPTDEALARWKVEEASGETRIDEHNAVYGRDHSLSTPSSTGSSYKGDPGDSAPGQSSNEESNARLETADTGSGSQCQRRSDMSNNNCQHQTRENELTAPHNTWLGMMPALRDDPQEPYAGLRDTHERKCSLDDAAVDSI